MERKVPLPLHFHIDIVNLETQELGAPISFGRTATAVRPKEIGAPNSWVSRFTISTAIDLKMERKVPLPLHFHIDIVNLETQELGAPISFGRTATAVRGAPRFLGLQGYDINNHRFENGEEGSLPLHFTLIS